MPVADNDPQLIELRSRCAALEVRVAELNAVGEQFVDNVSHEFRTPLTVIREYASILRDGLVGPVAPAQRRHLELIIDRGDDLALLVEDLLDVGKFESGLSTARRKPCRAADVFSQLKPSLQRKASLRGVTLDFDLGDGLPGIYCDAEKVQRILANLAANAIKFSEPSGHVQLWARIASASEMVLGVSDNGPGIGAEDAAIIFERFAQLDPPLRSSTKGLGLGLAVARQLTTMNLGQIMLASEPGEGSTFSFTVPRATPAAVLHCYMNFISRSLPATAGVSLIDATIGENEARQRSSAVDEFLHHVMGWSDLIWQAGPAHWRLIVPGGPSSAAAACERITTRWDEFRRAPATSTAPEIQLAVAGHWPISAALVELHARFGDTLTVAANPFALDLRAQQQVMQGDACSLLSSSLAARR